MATRFYLPSSGATAISPTVDGAWVASASTFFRAILPTAKTSTAMRTDADTSITSLTNGEVFAQFVSNPLAAQTIAANSDVSWSIRCNNPGLGSISGYCISIRVIAPNGSTVRGTFYQAGDIGNTWANDSLVSQYETITTGTSSVSVTEGDHLVVEFGCTASASGRDASMRFGDNAANDLDAADSDSGDDNPWIEFEHNFTFPTTSVPNQLMMMGCGT